MKIFALVVFLFISVTGSVDAFLMPQSPLGSPGNPIYFQEVKTYEQKQQEMIARYGSSEFYSCMASASACSGDMSSPSTQNSCLTSIEYSFSRGVCGRSQPAPTVICNAGYTLINGSCVQNQVTSPYVTYCSAGNWITEKGCVPIETSTKTATPSVDNGSTCRASYGENSYWTGKFDSDGAIECDCLAGYELNSANQCVVKATTAEVTINNTVANQCTTFYGDASYWSGAASNNGCVCVDGYHFNSSNTFCVKNEGNSKVPDKITLPTTAKPASTPTKNIDSDSLQTDVNATSGTVSRDVVIPEEKQSNSNQIPALEKSVTEDSKPLGFFASIIRFFKGLF